MTRKPCIYICGPMTGHPNKNFAEFERVAALLRSAGYPVVNPADYGDRSDTEGEANWSLALRRDLMAMMGCEALALLDGWERSKGARLEVNVANELGMPVTPYRQLPVE